MDHLPAEKIGINNIQGMHHTDLKLLKQASLQIQYLTSLVHVLKSGQSVNMHS